MGEEICLPADPQRLLFPGDVGPIAMALGAAPVGYDRYMQMFSWDYPGVLELPRMEGVPYVGFLPRDDLETVATVAPDLIISESYWPDLNENLAKIAPTVVVDTDHANAWRVRQDAVAAILDREEESAALIAGLEARLASVRDRLGDDPPTFAIAQSVGETDTVRIHTVAGLGASVFEMAGMSVAPGVLAPDGAVAAGGDVWTYDLSLERVGDIAADYIFAVRDWGDDPKMGIFDEAVWTVSPALADSTIVRVDRNVRPFVGEYIQNAHWLIDLVYREVLGLDPQEVDPNPFAAWLPTE
ncbi:MAG: ABC transporter substrate-binding protein [Pseudomonadota bacterium]